MHKLMCRFVATTKKIFDPNLDTACPVGIPSNKQGDSTTVCLNMPARSSAPARLFLSLVESIHLQANKFVCG